MELPELTAEEKAQVFKHYQTQFQELLNHYGGIVMELVENDDRVGLICLIRMTNSIAAYAIEQLPKTDVDVSWAEDTGDTVQ